MPAPLDDPFYTTPLNVSSYSPGQIIRSRPVSTLLTGVSVRSHQLLYRTSNQQNKSSATVTTIWAPARPAKLMKIFSYQVAEDSVSPNCAPSWAFVNTSSLQTNSTLQGGFVVPWALSQGWYVVSSDFEQNSAFLVGLVEARAVLDGIRAAAQHFGIAQNDTFEVGLYGYSGGAHATVWACSQAQSYAPELNIIGAAYGGTPVDVNATFNFANGGPLVVESIAAFIGNTLSSPKANETLYPLLTSKGRMIWQLLQGPDFCSFANASLVAYTNITDLFTKDIFQIPFIQRTIADQSLLSNSSLLPIPVPKFPRLEFHGLNDTTVPIQPEIEYVKQQCARGANIRLALFPGLAHNPTEINGTPGALLFIKQAFDKTLVNGTCGSNTTFPQIGSTAAIDLLGQDNNAALATYFIQAVQQTV